MGPSTWPVLSAIGVVILIVVGSVVTVRSGRRYRQQHGRPPTAGQRALFLALALALMVVGSIVIRLSG